MELPEKDGKLECVVRPDLSRVLPHLREFACTFMLWVGVFLFGKGVLMYLRNHHLIWRAYRPLTLAFAGLLLLLNSFLLFRAMGRDK